MTITTKAPEVLKTLKHVLKARQITYRRIAEHLSISEQSVKRIFREGDCTLSRIAKICELAEIKLSELLDFSNSHVENLTDLTPIQSQYLAERPGHFTFLFLLCIGTSLSAIKTVYKQTDVSILKYLRDLSNLGLIELGVNNQIRLLFKGQPMMRLHGPLHELVRQANIRFLNHCVDHDGKHNALFSSTFRFVSEQTMSELISELQVLTSKYRRLAQRDALMLKHNQLKSVKWSFALAEFSPLGIWPLPEHPEVNKTQRNSKID